MNIDPVEEIALYEKDAISALLPRLMGRVFHVSKAIYFESIKSSGAILPNANGELESSFGSSSNSYFKNRECVSVFDYRNQPTEQFDKFMGRCSPLRPAYPDSAILIYYLGGSAIDRLETWEGWKTGKHFSEMALPYLEAGHPGPIPLSEIDEILKVKLIEDPNSIAAIMRTHAKVR